MADVDRDGQRSLVAVVTGDVTMDWHIAHVRRETTAPLRWTGDDLARASWQRGGAALLADLVGAVAKRLQRSHSLRVDVRSTAAPRRAPQPSDARFPRSYAKWFPARTGRAGEPGCWRVEQFLGLDVARGGHGAEPAKRVRDDAPDADLVVLDDADLGFRRDRRLWPRAITEVGCRPWIVLKIAKPVAQGDLWDHLILHHPERLIVLMTIGDLRRTAVQISQRISWEQTAEDLSWELTYNPQVNGLSRAAHAIVSLGTVGSFLLTARPEPPAVAELLFDPAAMEGEWAGGEKGAMIGNTATLTAAIVRELLLDLERPDLGRAICAGVAAMRQLFDTGYDQEGEGSVLRYPHARMAESICGEPARLARARVQPPLRLRSRGESQATPGRTREGAWTILGDSHPESLGKLAESVVRDGIERALGDVPVARFGKLTTVDRREIEALRSIRGLIAEYCDRADARPLSIAVFGPPGAGKSFAVKQVAASIRAGTIAPITFNLSQFDGPEALIGCFHQVRDLALTGRIPLVFWDEFDASLAGEELGWLRHFLVPMQDGEFQEGMVCHPIGKAVFVFAGGTAERMSGFAAHLDEAKRRARKVPDFKSRLRGFLDVLGPDPQSAVSDGDPYHVIRRAIVLRGLFERSARHLLQGNVLRIESGVLRGFLEVSRYWHGARSMEALISTSQLSGESCFERSCLPPESQLDLHVDATEFLAHVHQCEVEGELRERLAAALHEKFCAQLVACGYSYGERNDAEARTHSSLRPFAELAEDEQEQNRQAAQDIPRKLASRGYVMMPDRRDAPPFAFSKEEEDALAALEHQRWMDRKLRDGWKYSEAIDKARKLHQDLLPYEQLSEQEKEKDREQVRQIPVLLAQIGYTVVPLRDR